ncbi:hypothetical protein [Microbacterium rhizophilus]
MSKSTLEVLHELLGNVQISVAASNFDELAQRLGTAKRELAEELAAAE